MKKFALCNETKLCAICGRRLELRRKNVNWYNEKTGLYVKKMTNIFFCSVCNLEHVIKGSHIDETGWNKLILPITNNPQIKKTNSSQGGKSSPVHTYYDPSLIKPQQETNKQNKEEKKTGKVQGEFTTPIKSESTNQAIELLKEKKGIKPSNSHSKRCKKCDFYLLSGNCSVHRVETKPDDYCKRYKHYFVKIYLGGRMSPK